MPEHLVLLAPGAGAPSTSPWMQAWARRLRALGPVVTLDYPYALAGRRRPDPLPRLIDAHREALAAARAAHPALPVVLAGKSMGSRVGCHVVAEGGAEAADVRALVCLGYPLVGATGKVRDEVLLALRAPVLFVQGTRDRLCPLDRLAAVRARMTARSALHVVEAGDHSLEVTKGWLRAAGRSQGDVDEAVRRAVERFVVALGGA
ncbi:MAG: alpha/beta hydrolase [Planctomycetes bacterium]|nr:alpha/beta hydrolase [Planctomycetota bacterium]